MQDSHSMQDTPCMTEGTPSCSGSSRGGRLLCACACACPRPMHRPRLRDHQDLELLNPPPPPPTLPYRGCCVHLGPTSQGREAGLPPPTGAAPACTWAQHHWSRTQGYPLRLLSLHPGAQHPSLVRAAPPPTPHSTDSAQHHQILCFVTATSLLPCSTAS